MVLIRDFGEGTVIMYKENAADYFLKSWQALGPFISTFADPAITALLHNENGEIVITDPDQLAER